MRNDIKRGKRNTRYTNICSCFTLVEGNLSVKAKFCAQLFCPVKLVQVKRKLC